MHARGREGEVGPDGHILDTARHAIHESDATPLVVIPYSFIHQEIRH
jgi:hypothetical protein